MNAVYAQSVYPVGSVPTAHRADGGERRAEPLNAQLRVEVVYGELRAKVMVRRRVSKLVDCPLRMAPRPVSSGEATYVWEPCRAPGVLRLVFQGTLPTQSNPPSRAQKTIPCNCTSPHGPQTPVQYCVDLGLEGLSGPWVPPTGLPDLVP